MKWWISLLLVLGLGVGFYLKAFIFDPVVFVMMIVTLINNYAIMGRQQQTATLTEASHKTIVANQREILKRIDVIRQEARKR